MQNTNTYLSWCRENVKTMMELVKSEMAKNRNLEQKLHLVEEENKRLLQGYSAIMANNILIDQENRKLTIENQKLKNEINLYLQ